MTKHFLKKFTATVTAVFLLCGIFAGCTDTTPSPSNDIPSNSPNASMNPGMMQPGGTSIESQPGTMPTLMDFSESEQTVLSACDIDLSQLKTKTDLSNTRKLDSDGIITSPGTYILSGTYENGISFDGLAKNDEVHLILNSATIFNSTGSAIVKSSKKISLYITLEDGTNNTISTEFDGANAVHVKGNLYINGKGSLDITSSGAGSSTIKASGEFATVNANLTLSSTKHGISAETISASDATISIISAAKDGLHAESDYDNSDNDRSYGFTLDSGFVYLENTNYSCNVDGDGIQADTFVYIDGGKYDITTNGTFLSYSTANMKEYGIEKDDYRYIKNGSTYQKVASDYNGNITYRYALMQGCKGIKAGEIEYDSDGDGEDDVIITDNAMYTIIIKSGDITINSTDDAIHCNSGDVYVYGGNITIDTFDDAVTSDRLTSIKGGDIVINTSYEGIEGGYVEILGGNIKLYSTDDGINAASDDKEIKEYIYVADGNIFVNADGDGLDSNGSILITGGNLTVQGPTSGADGSLDSETGILINGGTVIVYGSLGMMETPASNSTQYVVSYISNTGIADGTTITVKDSNSNVIFEFEIEQQSSSVIISCPEFKENETYTVYSGENELETFTVTSVITSIGSNFGGGMHNGMGGFGGGMKPDDIPGGGDMPTPPDGDFGKGDMPTLPDGNFGGSDMQPPQKDNGQTT